MARLDVQMGGRILLQGSADTVIEASTGKRLWFGEQRGRECRLAALGRCGVVSFAVRGILGHGFKFRESKLIAQLGSPMQGQ